MEAILGGVLFVVMVVAQVAAVMAVNAERRRAQQPDALDAIKRDPLARAVWNSGD